MSDWIHKLGGRFMVFDGPDGSGKSSQFRRFADLVRSHGITVCEVREPGGTRIGEQVRQILLSRENTEMDLCTEMLLYMASRAQLVRERVAPALEDGQFVLADRFVSSTLAYQGTAGGMSRPDIETVGHIACGSIWPDFWVFFDVDSRTAGSRLNPLLDRMEAKGAEFHAQVRQGYLDQASADPDHCLVINAALDEDTVFRALLDGMARRLDPRPDGGS